MTTVLPSPASDPTVDRHDIDRSFDHIRQLVDDPDQGLFGPESMMWRIVKPLPVVPLMLLEAGLLEAPHPYIAFGTMGSKSATEFVPRFHRSADAFYDWFCGDLDTALRTARRVFGYHSQIKGNLPEDIGGFEQGHPYAANEQDVLIWVWATIIRPLKEYYEALHGRITGAETARYYDECRRFALLFGIDQERLPKSWSAFTSYFDAVTSSPVMDLSAEFLKRPGPLSEKPTGPWKARALTKLVLSVGRARGLEPADVVAAIVDNSHLDGEDVSNVRVLERFSFVEVPGERAGEVVEKVNGQSVRGVELRLEVASK
jgi:uncharacterized protein (DUF2236 family)